MPRDQAITDLLASNQLQLYAVGSDFVWGGYAGLGGATYAHVNKADLGVIHALIENGVLVCSSSQEYLSELGVYGIRYTANFSARLADS